MVQHTVRDDWKYKEERNKGGIRARNVFMPEIPWTTNSETDNLGAIH